MHAVQAMENVRAGLAHGKVDFAGKGVEFEDYKSIVGFEQWAAIEAKYQPAFSTPALPAEACDRLRDHGFDLCVIGEIATNGDGLMALGGQLLGHGSSPGAKQRFAA
jgi:hypothetical protein